MINMEEKPPADAASRKYTVKDAIGAIMLAVVAAIVVVVILAYLTEINFATGIDWKQQGANALLLVICSVSVTIIMRQWGRMKGETTAAHADAEKAVEDNIGKIIGSQASGYAAAYCRDWEHTNFKSRVERILLPYNLTYDVYTKLRIWNKQELEERFGGTYSAEQLKAVLRAKRVRMQHYDENFILTNYRKRERNGAPSAGLTINQRNAIMTVQNIVTSCLLSAIMVSFAIEVISEPSLATVVSCLLKVVTLLLSALWATWGGYNLSANTETARMRLQATEQQRFLAWVTENKAALLEKQKAEAAKLGLTVAAAAEEAQAEKAAAPKEESAPAPMPATAPATVKAAPPPRRPQKLNQS